MKVYRCLKCKKTLLVLRDSGCTPVCCDSDMKELKANDTDGALEKHVPFVEVEGNVVKVVVGSTLHVMTPDHYIEFIALETNLGVSVVNLQPGDEPKAEFILREGEKALAAYELCNLHGLWKYELK